MTQMARKRTSAIVQAGREGGAPAPGRWAPVVWVLALAVLSACDPYVHGNGVFAEETRDVPAFDGVSVGLGIVATVRSAAADRSVTISGDENVLQYIDTRVVDGVLRTELSGVDGFDSAHQVQLVIATPELVEAEGWGSARVDVSSVDAAAFSATAREGSDVSVAAADGVLGTALTLKASGTSTVDALSFPVDDAQVLLSTGSRAAVHATGTVTGSLTGGSTLDVQGGAYCDVATSEGSIWRVIP